MATTPININQSATDLVNKMNEVAGVADTAKSMAESSSGGGIPTAFERNRHRGSVLFSQARYYYMSAAHAYKLPQFLVVTDNHISLSQLNGAINLSDNFPSIDGIVQLGDLVNTYTEWTAGLNAIKSSTKPVYMVIGNHDCGQAKCVHHCADNSQLYNTFIKPMVDKGWLKSGEYTVGRCHWYHDFEYWDISAMEQRTLRIIGINEYDYPADDVADFNTDYWEPITYDSSYQTMAYNTAYNVGDKVNAGGYKQYSFQCVQACTTPSASSDGDAPKYKYTRGNSYISKDQAEWLRDTLLGTPANGSVVVLMHQLIDSDVTFKTEFKFCANDTFQNRGSYQDKSVVYELLNAFANGSSGTLQVSANSYLPDYGAGVTYDFSEKNEGVVVCPSLNGHTHTDEICTKGSIVQISSICTGLSQSGKPDINQARPSDSQYLSTGKFITDDCLNVVTFDPTNKKVKLCKLGATYTFDGYQRDQEEINWDTLTTPIYGDKQVKTKIDELSE